MSLKRLVDICVVVVGVYFISVGIFNPYPEVPRWGWIVLGSVLLASKGVKFYLAFYVRRRRELAAGVRPSKGNAR